MTTSGGSAMALPYTHTDKQPEAYLQTDHAPYKYLAYRDLPSLMQARCPNKAGATALDFGCGAGFSTKFLLRQGFSAVTGVDANGAMLEKARKECPGATFVETKLGAPELPFPENSFDLVFSSFVLFEISTLEEVTRYLREIRRVLKPGGTLVAITGTEELHDPARQWLDLGSDFPENCTRSTGSKVKLLHFPTRIEFSAFFYRLADYEGALREAGLSLEEVRRPLGKPDDGYEWKDESTHPSYMALVATKPQNGAL